ncbi:hypothetical protein [Nonomuraea cavernae]|uniref:Uncharacterized protein n=1 Tax=Nonomuraea cavernae TaxID=2045107 RepID=A0A918DUD8_9ACTN|nr:hypothetical protein [Nonomuraea cavernae]MCA2190988.1 hypothetical protein [Nonomuraea cavernae]GGO83651.1 hypothetical protein GCM10012289_77560 [Nonomuraea cavernae]
MGSYRRSLRTVTGSASGETPRGVATFHPEPGRLSAAFVWEWLLRVFAAVEFTRVVPASGNLAVCGQQFWPGTHRAGLTLTLRADTGTGTEGHLGRVELRPWT